MTERSKFPFRTSLFSAVGCSLAPLCGAYGLLVMQSLNYFSATLFWSAGCSGTDLVENDGVSCLDPVLMCLVVEDGASDVMYNETVATYRVVNSGHCIEGNVTRRCLSHGHWDGMIPSFPRGAHNVDNYM